MGKEVPLPSPFTAYMDKVSYVQRISDHEWSSSCPECGGELHHGGEWPDRCRWFCDGRPRGWCRRCGTMFWPDDSVNKPSPADITRWRTEQLQREEQRERSAQLAQTNLAEAKVWEQYHNGMALYGREYWRKRGIADSLQNFWQLGYDKAHSFYKNSTQFQCQTATIPIFGPGWEPKNIKHRLVNGPDDYPKYKYELTGISGLMFLTDPDEPPHGQTVAVEGEIKAMVVAQKLGTLLGTVVGLPGITPGAEVLNTLGQADRIILIVDPGGREAAWNICKTVGKHKFHVLVMPENMGKIDDWINEARPTTQEVRWFISQAALPAYK